MRVTFSVKGSKRPLIGGYGILNWRQIDTGQILEGKYPERVLTQAVKRMLPGNRLSRQVMTNLRVYAGAEHPHVAQEPDVLDVKIMNKKNTRV